MLMVAHWKPCVEIRQFLLYLSMILGCFGWVYHFDKSLISFSTHIVSLFKYNPRVANGLIRATDDPLGDYFSKNILGIFSKKVFKKIFKNLKKILCTILVRFVLKICQKYVIFKVFQVHLQVLLLFKKSGYKLMK
jgi:hypothetical protein